MYHKIAKILLKAFKIKINNLQPKKYNMRNKYMN